MSFATHERIACIDSLDPRRQLPVGEFPTNLTGSYLRNLLDDLGAQTISAAMWLIYGGSRSGRREPARNWREAMQGSTPARRGHR